MDHVVLVLFENRSLDNLLGRLYGPQDGKTFEGVVGKDLSNPIPEWAEHGAERRTVPYTVATDMDAPNPDSGEEYFHTNTQLFNVLDEHNRFKIGEAVSAPWNAPAPGAVPTMDGFVTDYISTFTVEIGRQPMLELLDELRALHFAVGIVTGGGTEFVRQLSRPLYGVEPGMVVGTLIGYEFGRDDDGKPIVRRTVSQIGKANEGGAKLENIQSQIGRAPILAVGNSGGDREMLEWAQASRHGGLAMLVSHDDAEREFAYESEAATFQDDEPITDVADRLDWVVVSMQRDWETIFAGR